VSNQTAKDLNYFNPQENFLIKRKAQLKLANRCLDFDEITAGIAI
jgi:hypothetical protein